MPSGFRTGFGPKALISLALALAGASALVAAPRPLDSIGASFWIESPYRDFRSPRQVSAGGAVLFDEADDPQLAEAIATELRRIQLETLGKLGWRSPFPEGEALRLYVTRREADGVRTVSARGWEAGQLIGPAILLDGSGLSVRQITREVSRLVHRAILLGYGAPDSSFVTDAVVEMLSGPRSSEEDGEAARVIAASPELVVAAHARTLGRLYVEELVRQSGPGSLRAVFEQAADSGEEVLPMLLRAFAETAGEPAERLTLRFAARLYALVESEPGPSRIGLLDLQSGGLDAAPPNGLALRHRTYLPAEQAAALRVSWPADGGGAAAVVRYREPSLPADVMFLAPGEVHTVPLAGVARVDWIVAGELDRPVTLRAPALFEPMSDFPFAGLAPQLVAAPEGSRLSWTTASHEGLVGWAVFREELLADGRILRTGPEIIPSSLSAGEPFRYAYVDTATAPGVYYRYTVWAVTADGLLARAFSATLRTAE
jgi:hypothetical protein